MIATVACLGIALFAQTESVWARHGWAEATEGSSVTFEGEYVTSEETKRSTDRLTVESVSKEQVVLKGTRTNHYGHQDGEAIPHTVQTAGSDSILPPEIEALKLESEKVQIDGKEFACEVEKFSKEGMTFKFWTSNEAKVPGHLLKFEASMGDAKIEGGVVKLSEKVKVGDKELECAVAEYEGEFNGEDMEAKIWLCPDVPGGVVRSEVSVQSPKGDYRDISVLTAFEKK